MIDTAGPKATSPVPGSPGRLGPLMDRRALIRAAVITAALLIALFALPPIMSGYYTDQMIQVAIYSIVTLGLGLLVGRVGMYSLGQLAVLTIGAWVGARLLFATGQPYILVLIEAGLVTMIIGSLITLPALRLRGLYLALITLMLAGGVTVIEATLNFPNGGGGFSGYNGSQLHIPQIRRPSFAGTDPAFYRFCVVVAIVMFLLVFVHLRTRPGRAWAAIRQSEPSALAAGINTTYYKLWAMALAAFVTGVAGALLAGADRELLSIDFPIQNSIQLLAVVLVGGAFSLSGAVVAAFLQALVPAALYNLWGVQNDWLIIIFGAGVMLTLVTSPGGIADQFPKDMRRLGGFILRQVRGQLPANVRPAPATDVYLDQSTGLTVPQGTQVASVGYRIGAYFLAVGLAVITLGVGYAIWGLISWTNGQTPAQQVLGLRCWKVQERTVASWGTMLLRGLSQSMLDSIACGGLVSLVMMLVNKDRRTLYDHISGVVVLRDPNKVLAVPPAAAMAPASADVAPSAPAAGRGDLA